MKFAYEIGSTVLYQNQLHTIVDRGVHVDSESGDAVQYYKLDGVSKHYGWVPKHAILVAPKNPGVTASAQFDFSQALVHVKAGQKVARQNWNGKNMFIFLVGGSTFAVSRPPLLGIYPEGTVINYHAHIDMRTADGTIVPWLASQTDLLADDWNIVD